METQAQSEFADIDFDELCTDIPRDEFEALFDPAPKKSKSKKGHGKRCGSAKQVRKMPQMFDRVCPGKADHGHARRVAYDPAPLKYQEVKEKAKAKAKGMMKQVMPYVPSVVGIAEFYRLYSIRAKELNEAGKLNEAKEGEAATPVKSVLDAIKYDIKHFEEHGGVSAIPDRLKAEWKVILGAFAGSMILPEVTKKTKHHKNAKILAKVLQAVAFAHIGKAILDPPVEKKIISGDVVLVKSVPAPAVSAAPVMQTQTPAPTARFTEY